MTDARSDAQQSGELDLIWLRPQREEQARRPPLSRERIVRAAVELADADGLEGLSMRRIASRLGAGTNSLYWYLNSKNDLFELMFDEVLGELELTERSSGDWRADLREIAHRVWLLARRHSWLGLLGIQPGLGPTPPATSSTRKRHCARSDSSSRRRCGSSPPSTTTSAGTPSVAPPGTRSSNAAASAARRGASDSSPTSTRSAPATPASPPSCRHASTSAASTSFSGASTA